MQTLSKLTLPIGRMFMGALFLVSGLLKIADFTEVSTWMASSGLMGTDALLAITIAIEAFGGLLLVLGWQTRKAALMLALFLVPVTVVFHGFWSADAANFKAQLTAFLKNFAILGGLLILISRSTPD